MASSARRPLSPTGTPTALNSCGYSPPTPTPRMTRPPVARSKSAICLATMHGGYSGRRRMDVPIDTLSVTAESRARPISASGEGFGEATWPPVHNESIGNASSAAASVSSPGATRPHLQHLRIMRELGHLERTHGAAPSRQDLAAWSGCAPRGRSQEEDEDQLRCWAAGGRDRREHGVILAEKATWPLPESLHGAPRGE